MQQLFQAAILPIGILRKGNMSYPYVEVNIFEDTKYPVVSHKFYGETIEEGHEYFKAHMKTDSFLRAAVNTRRFKGMKVKVEILEFR